MKGNHSQQNSTVESNTVAQHVVKRAVCFSAYLQWRSAWAVSWWLPPLPPRAGGSGCSWPPSCQIQSTGNGPPDWPSWWHWELPCKDICVWIWREHKRRVQSNIYYTKAQLAARSCLDFTFGLMVMLSSSVYFIKAERERRRNYCSFVLTAICCVLCWAKITETVTVINLHVCHSSSLFSSTSASTYGLSILTLQVLNVWFCVSLQHFPWATVNETISRLLSCDLYSHISSEARLCLCWQRCVCVACMVNLRL